MDILLMLYQSSTRGLLQMVLDKGGFYNFLIERRVM